MAKKFMKEKVKEKLKVSSKAKTTLPKIPLPKKTEETPEEQETTTEAQETDDATSEGLIEMERLNNTGYFRFHQLTLLTGINKNLAQLNESMEGIGEVLAELQEAIKESNED